MSPVTVTDQFQAPTGVYLVKFGGFTTRDNGVPVAKATDLGMRIYAGLVIHEGQYEGEEIPCGMDLESGVTDWCYVFSGMPPQSNDLVEIEKQMKSVDKALNVRVNDNGWAQGVFVPKGTYLARFSRFARRDENTGKPAIAVKEFQGESRQMVFWQFEIVAGDLTGVRVPGSCRYAVKQRGNDLELASRSSLYNWGVAAGVDFDKLPEFEDSDNILPELEEAMQRANVVLSVQVGDNGWVTGGQSAISPAPAGVTVAQRSETSEVSPGHQRDTSKAASQKDDDPFPPGGASKPASQSKGSTGQSLDGTSALDALLEAIDWQSRSLGFGQGVENGKLTDAGKKFAAEHIAPVCNEKGIPRAFGKMTEAQVVELTEAVLAKAKQDGGGDDDTF